MFYISDLRCRVWGSDEAQRICAGFTQQPFGSRGRRSIPRDVREKVVNKADQAFSTNSISFEAHDYLTKWAKGTLRRYPRPMSYSFSTVTSIVAQSWVWSWKYWKVLVNVFCKTVEPKVFYSIAMKAQWRVWGTHMIMEISAQLLWMFQGLQAMLFLRQLFLEMDSVQFDYLCDLVVYAVNACRLEVSVLFECLLAIKDDMEEEVDDELCAIQGEVPSLWRSATSENRCFFTLTWLVDPRSLLCYNSCLLLDALIHGPSFNCIWTSWHPFLRHPMGLEDQMRRLWAYDPYDLA